MKHFSGFAKIFETEIWYFWGNMMVLLGQLNWGLGTKGRTVTHLTKIFWFCILSTMFLSGIPFVENGVKTSIAGSYPIKLLLIQEYAQFWLFRKCSGSSFSITFSVWLFNDCLYFLRYLPKFLKQLIVSQFKKS